jgi:hypothetical protein
MSLQVASPPHIKRVIAQLDNDREGSIDPGFHIAVISHATLEQGQLRPRPEDTKSLGGRFTTFQAQPNEHHSPGRRDSDATRDFTVKITAHLEDRNTKRKLTWAREQAFALTYIINGNKHETLSIGFRFSGESKEQLEYNGRVPFPFSQSDSVAVYGKLKGSVEEPIYFHPSPECNREDKIEKSIRFYAQLK